MRLGGALLSTSAPPSSTLVCPTTGVKLRGPERSEGHVSFNSLVGLPLGFLAVQRPRLSEPSSSYTQSLFHASQLSYRRLLRVITLLRAAPGRRQRRPSHSCHSPRNPVLSDAPPFRRHTSSARSREPRPRQAPPGAAARGHSSMRIPEPLVDPVWPSSRFMRAPLARNSSGAHQPVPSSGSVGMTPASTKTTGTKNARWRVLVTMVANAPRSNRRAFIVQPERRLPSSMAPGRGLSLASPAPVPVVAARYFRRREAKREPSSESTNSPAAAVYWSASRGGHGDEGTAASAARQRRTPFQLCCAPPGRDRCEDLTPWGCLTRDHPEERTPLAWNSAHCDAFPPSTASRYARPQSGLPPSKSPA
jgi:hypothetical protein